MNRELSLEFVRVTEAAAIACGHLVGRGDKNGADGLAVDAMRAAFDTVNIKGTVVIGEGEMDEAPMLYIGEEVGAGGPEVDIAVDPIEGTNLVAKGQNGAIAVIAIAPRGCLLHAPDMYMDKIAVGPRAKGCIDINAPISENLARVAKAMDRKVSDLNVVLLDRERHYGLMDEIRKAGARISLITDGDVNPIVECCIEGSGVHMYVGKGGAPEGVLGAAAVKCLGGDMQARLVPEDEAQAQRCLKMGIADVNKVLTLVESGEKADDCMFTAYRYYQLQHAERSALLRRRRTYSYYFCPITKPAPYVSLMLFTAWTAKYLLLSSDFKTDYRAVTFVTALFYNLYSLWKIY